MASSLHRKKRIRQNVKRRAANQQARTRLKTQVRRVNDTLHAGSDAAQAETQLREAVKLIDRAASKGKLHPNAAARRKALLARRLNAMKSKAGQPEQGRKVQGHKGTR